MTKPNTAQITIGTLLMFAGIITPAITNSINQPQLFLPTFYIFYLPGLIIFCIAIEKIFPKEYPQTPTPKNQYDPEYEEGYYDALHNTPQPTNPTIQYQTGYQHATQGKPKQKLAQPTQPM